MIESLNELEQRLSALGEITDQQRNEITCSLIGHSRITTYCFGYHYCGRCETQIGDSLGGSYVAKENVISGHDCPTCRENYQKCTWRDTYRVKDPFAKG